MVFFINNINSIEKFYEEELRDELLILDVFRKNYRNIFLWLRGIIFLIIAVALLIANFTSLMTGTIISLLIFTYPLIKLWSGSEDAKEEYTLYYKNRIIDRVIKFTEEKLENNSNEQISQNTFESSMMFSKKVDAYKSENLITGVINDIIVLFSEIHAEYSIGTGKRKSLQTLFKGIFIIAELDKEIDSITIITPHTEYKEIGTIESILQYLGISTPKFEIVKVENTDFKKYFTVYSNNNQETKELLSISLMNNLVKIREIVDKDINISLTSSQIFIGIPFSEKIFEIPVFLPIVNTYQIKKYYDAVNLVVKIIKELEFNNNQSNNEKINLTKNQFNVEE